MRTKSEIVEQMKELYKSNSCAIFIDYKGVDSQTMYEFRKELREKCGVRFFIVKNSLNEIAMKEFGYNDKIKLSGQCGVVFSNSIDGISKVVNNICFKNKKAGFVSCLNERDVCNEAEFKEIASLPSLEEIRVKLLYVLNFSASSLVRVIAEKSKEAK